MDKKMLKNPTKEALAEEMPLEALLEDIRRLDDKGPIATQGRLDVYWAQADAIPSVLLEIGRLRELTFRGVGEGVGRARDLDERDEYYSHLFLWDREAQCIVGGYRIARMDMILAEFGFEGLYTSTLCEMDQSLIDYLNPGLELGRSWVHPDYQKSLGALLGLWKGVCHFVALYPRYHKLFGAVSISDDYTKISQNLMVRYLRRTKTDGDWSPSTRALLPFQDLQEDLTTSLASIEDVSAQVSQTEPDGKGIPVLLRQYFKMNATLLEFAYDPNFQHCLDAMILVDLRKAPSVLLKKYMGKQGYERFSATISG